MEINFTQIASAIFVLALCALTLIICLEKWRAFEFYQLYRPRWAPPNVCVFCLGFWISFLILISLAQVCAIPHEIFIAPFASASLTRSLYESIGINRR